jgi:threonyl-tRNA synthetase
MLVRGENEVQDGTIVTVRKRDGGDQGAVKLDDFIADVRKEIDERI